MRFKISELGQSFEVFQPGVADMGAIEVQGLELGQSFEVFQPGIVDSVGPVDDDARVTVTNRSSPKQLCAARLALGGFDVFPPLARRIDLIIVMQTLPTGLRNPFHRLPLFLRLLLSPSPANRTAMATTTVSTSNERMLNWKRRRKSGRAEPEDIKSIATPMAATAISTVQPLCRLKANHSNRSDSSRKPSRASSRTTTRSGVRRYQRDGGCQSCQGKIVQLGNARWSFFTPASVTLVPCRSRFWSLAIL